MLNRDIIILKGGGGMEPIIMQGIKVLCLSEEISKLVAKEGIDTIEKLIWSRAEEYSNIRGIGKSRAKRINDALSRLDLNVEKYLSNTIYDLKCLNTGRKRQLREEGCVRLEKFSDISLSDVCKIMDYDFYKTMHLVNELSMKHVKLSENRGRNIFFLDLTITVKKVLFLNNIFVQSEIENMSIDEILRLRGIGKRRIGELSLFIP